MTTGGDVRRIEQEGASNGATGANVDATPSANVRPTAGSNTGTTAGANGRPTAGANTGTTTNASVDATASASPARGARRRPVRDGHPVLADRERLAAVCIDMGSVVVDERHTWGLWQSLTVKTLKANGHRVDRRRLLQALRTAMLARAPRVSQQALVELGVDPAAAQEVWSQVTNRDRPLTYAAAALERLAARYQLIMVANQGLHARGLLEAASLDRYFAHLLLSDEIKIAKPDERIFHLALEAAGVEPDRVAMLGDRLDLDIEPSRRLGMLAVRIRRGPFACQEPRHDEERPHLTFNSLPAAARWLAP